MKLTRLKRIRKQLKHFLIHFNLRPPYRVLLEGAFLQAALENQVMVREQITQMLQADCRLYITRCVLAELRAAGGFFAGAAQIASQFSVFTCSHGAENLPSRQCLLSACGKDNSDHVIVAAQSFELREKLRKVPGVPIIYLQGQVPLLDDISKASTKAAVENEAAKNLPTTAERKATLEVVQRMVNAPLPAAVAASFPVKSKAPAPIIKRKMPKAPNPLSCKKAKKSAVAPAAEPVAKPAPSVASSAAPAPTAASAPASSPPAAETAAASTAPTNASAVPPVSEPSKKRKADDQSDGESGDEQGAKKKKTRRGRRKISQQREM